MNHGPLEGIRVTEFTTAWAGPYTTCLLGFLGAEIIKVETHTRLDHTRITSFTTSRTFDNPDASSVFNILNLNKLSVCLNLKRPEAVAIAKRLVAVSEVVVENMRPGVIGRIGLDYEALCAVKPDIVYLSSSACGQTGPDRGHVGYAPNFAAAGGLSYLTGYEDWPPSLLTGAIDLRSATTGTYAILAALVHRQRTGEGQYIDMAAQEAIAVLTGDALMDYAMNGRVGTRKGNHDDIMAPHGCYRCRGEDAWISIAVGSEEEWQALCAVMGKPELLGDDRFATPEGRRSHRDELDAIIGTWTADRGDYELMHLLQRAGVAAAPSLSNKALFEDPHVRARETFLQVEHPVLGKEWVVSPPWRFSETPASIGRHAPLIGEHNERVFGGLLGMSAEEIERLEKDGVIH